MIRQIDFFLEKNKFWRFCSNSKIEIEKIFGLSSCVSVKSGKLEWTSVTKARTWSRAPPVWKFFQKWKKWKKWNKWKVCNQNFSTRKSVCNARVHFSLTPGLTSEPHLKKIEVVFFVFSKNFLEICSKISSSNSTIRNLQIDCTKSIDKSEINVRKRKLLKIAG